MSKQREDYPKEGLELKPNVNDMSDPDDYNPGPTDMIEDAVGEIMDNISGDHGDQRRQNKSTEC